jgi:hypothetical protein
MRKILFTCQNFILGEIIVCIKFHVGLENREYGRRGFIALTTWQPLSAKVGTSSTSGGRSVGIFRFWTRPTEISLLNFILFVTFISNFGVRLFSNMLPKTIP